MSTIISIEEILQIAIQIEVNGKRFYESAAHKTDNKYIKELFLHLAQEEVGHKMIFTNLHKELGEKGPSSAYPDEYYQYLAAMAKNHVFSSSIDELLNEEEINDERKAINMAINFEKESILLFHEMKYLVYEDDKHIIEKLIDEERSHYMKLVNKRDEI